MPVSITLTGQDYNSPRPPGLPDGRAGPNPANRNRRCGTLRRTDRRPRWRGWRARCCNRGKRPSACCQAGKAALERGPSVELKGQHVSMYSIGGLDFTPEPVWLDGPAPRPQAGRRSCHPARSRVRCRERRRSGQPDRCRKRRSHPIGSRRFRRPCAHGYGSSKLTKGCSTSRPA